MPAIQIPNIVPSGQHTQQGIAGLQNAMAFRSNMETQQLQQNRMGMQNQDMAKEMQDRQELEALLGSTPPEQRERAGLEFLKARDPEKAAKLQATYIDRFAQKARLDPKNAAMELERATGEKIELGNRYSKLPIEGGEAYVDNFTGHVFQPNSAKELAQVRADFAMAMEKQRQEGRTEIESLKSELGTEKLKQQQEFTASENEKNRAAQLKAAGIRQAGANSRADRVDRNRQFQQGATLADDFDKQSKNFVVVRDAYERVKTSASNPSAAGDLSLIFAYMKMLDPTSTVREGEFANAQNSGSIPQTLVATYNKAINGQRLSDLMRKDFVGRANMLYKSAADQQRKVTDTYRNRAKTFEIPEHLVISDMGAVSEDASPGAPKKQPKIISIQRIE